MTTIRRLLSLTLGLALALVMTACGAANSNSADKKEIRYGKAQGPYTVLFEDAIVPILAKQGYTAKAVEFSDLVTNDVAVNEKEVDLNVEQHTAYMNNFNTSKNGKLVAIGPVPTVPAGIFSARHKSLTELADGDKIAVPNDASNTARAYALLQKAGWIKLTPGKSLTTVTKDDIVENPHNLQFTELGTASIPPALSDFSFAVITGSIVYSAKIDPASALLQEDILPDLILQVVVHADNKDAKWAKDVVAAYHSQEFKDYMNTHNKGLWFIPQQLR